MIRSLHRYKYYNSRISERRRGNPYFSNKRADHFGTSFTKNFLAKIPPRVWLWFFLFIIIIISLGWLLFFSNILVIKNIQVNGANLIPVSDIENMAMNRLNEKKFLILSQSRLANFDSNNLKKEITDRYVVDNIKIVKKIPSTLIINITEKNPAAVWFEADMYLEIDSAGWVLAQVASAIEGLPIIYNNGWPKIKNPNEQSSNKQVEGADKIISFAKLINGEFPTRFPKIKIKQLAVDNEKDTIKLVPERGAIIYWSTLDDIYKQFDRLDILLNSELKDRFEKVNRIDLRYGDKVYFQ